jgi:hypothetical protein
MKINTRLTCLFISMLIVLTSCSKHNGHDILPLPVSFEIIGKDGKSMVTSVKDSISVSYTENGVLKNYRLTVTKLRSSGSDTGALAKYNGLYITDNAVMTDLSIQANPVQDFAISLNGVKVGDIHFYYWGYLDAYPKISSANLTFNKVPTRDDRTGDYFTPGSNINLFQL